MVESRAPGPEPQQGRYNLPMPYRSRRVPADLSLNRLAEARARIGEIPFDLTISNPTACGILLPGRVSSLGSRIREASATTRIPAARWPHAKRWRPSTSDGAPHPTRGASCSQPRPARPTVFSFVFSATRATPFWCLRPRIRSSSTSLHSRASRLRPTLSTATAGWRIDFSTLERLLCSGAGSGGGPPQQPDRVLRPPRRPPSGWSPCVANATGL